MKKSVQIKEVKLNTSFFTTHLDGRITEYVKYSVLHRDCYSRINGASFGLGVNGPNKNSICVFDNNAVVDIEVPAVTFNDLSVGDKFKLGGDTYTKIYDHTSSSYKMLTSSMRVYGCTGEIEVEIVE